MEAEAVVIPNSKEFSVTAVGRSLRVRLTEKAEKGRANRELVEKLSKHFGCAVRIVRGFSSRRKTLSLEMSEEEFARKAGGVSL